MAAAYVLEFTEQSAPKIGNLESEVKKKELSITSMSVPGEPSPACSQQDAVLVETVKSELTSLQPNPEDSVLDVAVTASDQVPEVSFPPSEVTAIMKETDENPSVAIQANDYEIERSGILPARRRFIPYKFRDFHDPEHLLNEDPDDDEYIPCEGGAYIGKMKRRGKRGRPPKSHAKRTDHAYENNTVAPSSEQQENPEAPVTVVFGMEDVAFKCKRGRPPKDAASGGRKIFKCLLCERKFTQKGNLKAHMLTHSGERPFKCSFAECEKAFTSNESLRRHKLAHMGIKLFECQICKSRFSSNVAMKEHMARHTDTRSYQCVVCNRLFRQNSCLRRHMVTHSADTPYDCQICHRKFSQHIYLRSHMRMHTGEKPFTCTLCKKQFSHHSDLNRHKIIHSGEKPYECGVCGARFSDPSSRRRHTKEHSGDKPFPCDICNESFKRAGQLKAHLAKKHCQKLKAGDDQTSSTEVQEQLQMEGVLGKPGNSVVKIQAKNDNMVFHFVPLEVGDGSQAGQKCLLEEQQVFVQEVNLSESQLEGVTLGRQVQLGPSGQGEQVLIDSQGQQHAVSIGQAAPQQAMEFSHDVAQSQIAAEASVVASQAENPNELAAEAVLRMAAMEADSGTQLSEVAMETAPAMPSSDTGYSPQLSGARQVDSKEGNKYLSTLPTAEVNNTSQTLGAETVQKESFLEETCQILDQIRNQIEGEDPQNNVEYRIIQEGANGPQILEIQYHNPKLEPLAQQTEAAELLVMSTTQKDRDGHSRPDYVNEPDFNSQDYYNWLSQFTELVKMVAIPLEMDLFQKISQVHKSLSDILASPQGILTNKENFKTLLSISTELNTIINQHLTYVLQNLDGQPEDS